MKLFKVENKRLVLTLKHDISMKNRILEQFATSESEEKDRIVTIYHNKKSEFRSKINATLPSFIIVAPAKPWTCPREAPRDLITTSC
jgi:hypothetical protein